MLHKMWLSYCKPLHLKMPGWTRRAVRTAAGQDPGVFLMNRVSWELLVPSVSLIADDARFIFCVLRVWGGDFRGKETGWELYVNVRWEWGCCVVLYASFHGWQKIESPHGCLLLLGEAREERLWGPRERKRESWRNGVIEGGGGPAITWDGSNHSWLISLVPRLPLFTSSPPSPWSFSLHFSVPFQRNCGNRFQFPACWSCPVKNGKYQY